MIPFFPLHLCFICISFILMNEIAINFSSKSSFGSADWSEDSLQWKHLHLQLLLLVPIERQPPFIWFWMQRVGHIVELAKPPAEKFYSSQLSFQNRAKGNWQADCVAKAPVTHCNNSCLRWWVKKDCSGNTLSTTSGQASVTSMYFLPQASLPKITQNL